MSARSARSRRAAVSDRAASEGQARGVYVYALLGGPMKPRRLSGRPIDVIKVAGIHAAVEYRTTAPDISEDTLRQQHDIVVRLAQITDAILPVRFGAFVAAEELGRIIRLRQEMLRAALDEVRGREQMTVRILGKAEAVPPALERRSGTEYLLGLAASHRALHSPLSIAINDAVRPVVVRSHTDAGRGGVQLVLNHLIRRGHADEYRSLIESAAAAFEPVPELLISGPWPPFAFVPDLWAPERLTSKESPQ
jgi:hypothetical protein